MKHDSSGCGWFIVVVIAALLILGLMYLLARLGGDMEIPVYVDVGRVWHCQECGKHFIATHLMHAEEHNRDGYMGEHWYIPLLRIPSKYCPFCGSQNLQEHASID